MKTNKVNVFDMVKSPNKRFYAYGSKSPQVVLGSFKSFIKVNGKKTVATFYVIKNETKDL